MQEGKGKVMVHGTDSGFDGDYLVSEIGIDPSPVDTIDKGSI